MSDTIDRPVLSSLAALPTEIVQLILVAGIRDRHFGKPFGARCMRLARGVTPYIAPELYDTVDLWTETQAYSFLLAIQSNKPESLYQPRHFVHSVIIKTAAFSANEVQAHIDVGRLTPGGVTTMTTFAILETLNQAGTTRWEALAAPMVILATRRYPPPPPLTMPRSVTITGVDSLFWGAYNWDIVEKIRFTSYNPSLKETRWLAALPSLSHVAFAFYYDIPMGLSIIEDLAALDRIKCVLVVVYTLDAAKEKTKSSFRKLDEPKLVIWDDKPDSIAIFETEECDQLWGRVESIVEVQTLEKRAALSR